MPNMEKEAVINYLSESGYLVTVEHGVVMILYENVADYASLRDSIPAVLDKIGYHGSFGIKCKNDGKKQEQNISFC